jgi:hypothetical protein
MRCLREIQRQRADMAELPIARLMALYANAHLPEKRKPFDVDQFRVFMPQVETPGVMTATAAAAVLSLLRDEKLPPMLAAVMPEVEAAARPGIEPPGVRAMRSEDDSLWLVAPVWEGASIRAGIAGSSFSAKRTVLIHDVDRPILTYLVTVPAFSGAGWVEAGILLPARAT